jgi:RNA-directed DNA polymerase
MKESYRKGVANHPDPESCGVHREVQSEALTGAHVGWVLSFEIIVRECRRCQDKRKAKRTASKSRDAGRLPGVGDLRHAWKLGAREPGDPGGALRLERRGAGRGTHKGTLFTHAVGKSDHCVVPEKVPNKRRKACGGAGGKAVDQGELQGGPHGPATEQGFAVSQGLPGVRGRQAEARRSSRAHWAPFSSAIIRDKSRVR